MYKHKLKLELSLPDVCKMGNASTVCDYLRNKEFNKINY